MGFLLLVALLWGISYGANAQVLHFFPVGVMGVLQVFSGAALFFPFARHRTTAGLRLRCMAIGAVQLGAMYFFLLESCSRLDGHGVALLCLTTPLFFCLFEDALARRWVPHHLFCAISSVAIAAIALGGRPTGTFPLLGTVECLLANCCFAIGQVLYRRLRRSCGALPDATVLFWLYCGASLLWLPLLFFPFRPAPAPFPWTPLAIGAVPFLVLLCGGVANFLWNRGISRVSAGTVALMGNAPAVLGSIFGGLLFGEACHWPRQISALLLLLLLLLANSWLGNEISLAKLLRRLPFGRFLTDSRSCRWIFFCAVVTAAVNGFAGGFGIPLLLSYLARNVFADGGQIALSRLLFYASLPIALVGIRSLAGLVNTCLLAAVGQTILHSIRLHIFQKLQRLPLQFFRRSQSGDLISRAFNDASVIQSSFVSIAHEIFQRPVTLISAVAAVTYLCLRQSSGWILFLVLILVAASGLPIAYFGRQVWRHGLLAQERIATLTSQMASSMRAVQEVRAFCMERHQRHAFHRASREYSRAYLSSCRAYYCIVPSVETWAALGISLAFLCAYFLHIPGEVFLAIATALFLTYDPVKNIGRLYGNLQYTFSALARIEEFLGEPEAPTPGAALSIPGRLSGRVTFSHVSFSYGADGPVLRDINVTLEAGRSYALVGPSGAGKTTFANLILRFHAPQRGCIDVDGLDLQRLDVHQLRSQIAFVPQRATLIHASIRDNIRWGKVAARRDEIERAARRAGAMEFIEKLPRGLDTVVGEDGSYLSGGQRQRIALARALLRDAPILILDEPTSSLDARGEREIRATLPDLFRGRTVLLISHRSHWLPCVDEIFVLDGGRIVERGSHGALLSQEGLYRHLYAVHADADG
ncbi:MAG: ATP-binding cassette domain-containing protein [Puniceicoccales bacterium]|jgi:subfamily B ATP-binding cassette protein MsbA|nr:ATP-binding cassette domain-containing protein [Puniceicoccales bacterium]